MATAPPKTLLVSPPECRTAPRRDVLLRVQGRLPRGDEEVLLVNISQAGMLIESTAPLAEGETVAIHLPGGAPAEATVVWARQGYAGCRFSRRLSQEEIIHALLRSDFARPDEMELMRTHTETAGYGMAGDRGPPAAISGSGLRLQLIPGLAVMSWLVLTAVVAAVYLLLA